MATTTTTARDDYLQHEFNDHPSLASLDDYDASVRSSPAFEIPSQHSGFRAMQRQDQGSDHHFSDSDSAGPWSPPAWRRAPSGWFQPGDRQSASPQRAGDAPRGSGAQSSRESSPEHDEAEDQDVTLPASVPLPRSPEKQPSPSRSQSPEKQVKEEPVPEQTNNCKHNHSQILIDIRFAVRAEVQHRTEPIEAAVTFLRYQYRRITASKSSIFSFVSFLVITTSILRGLFQDQTAGPGPDLVRVAGLARSFEPLIHYSETGALQVGDLQETGVAVWDLGETVRYSNMTSAPIIVKELDDLGDSLKTLAIELTRFFANVDGDIDSILIVMEWAKRELSAVSAHVPAGRAQAVYENLVAYTRRAGGERAVAALTAAFGATHGQVAKAALQRTFYEFLNVLEDSINNELHYASALFALFEAIDRQYLNLQRTVMRETDSQDAEKERADSELADLWRRATGANKSRIHKFEKNKALLASIRDRTVRNKLSLVDHNGKLLKLKSNLEILRRRIVSPLLRSNASSTQTVAAQIEGLDGTYVHLRAARERQKGRQTERLYGYVGRRAGAIEAGSEEHSDRARLVDGA